MICFFSNIYYLTFKRWTSSAEVSLKITGYHQLLIFHLLMIRVKILLRIMRLCHFLEYLSVNNTGRTSRGRCYACMYIPTKRKWRKIVSTWCKEWTIPFYVECFNNYHTVKIIFANVKFVYFTSSLFL